jgi:DNA-binding YbaB/EbfC family protein
MFKDLGKIADLMKNLPRMKEEMDRLQQRLGQLTADGDAGGGMVKVRVNGRMDVLSCVLSDEALRLSDREMLEDMIVAAVNQALQRSRQLVAEETGKLATGLGLPAGLNLPGLET